MKKLIFVILLSTSTCFGYAKSVVKLALPNNCYHDITTYHTTVDQRLTDQLFLHPNPSQGNFYVKILLQQASEKCYFEIFDTKGRVVYQKIYVPYSKSIEIHFDLQSIPNGIYLIQLKTSYGVFVEKLVIN